MFATPALTPLTTPDELTVAIATLLVLHVPPVVVLLSVVESPMQVVGVPVLEDGDAPTVTTVVRTHPLDIV